MKNESLICTANTSNQLIFEMKMHVSFTKNGKDYSISTDEIAELIDGNDEGCKYCTGNVEDRENLLSDGELIAVYIDGNNKLSLDRGSWIGEDIQIRRCPMCGKKLEGKQ